VSGVVWLNGRIVPEREAAIAVDDRGFLLGDGIFETMRVQAGQVPLFDRHWARLVVGAGVLDLPVPDQAEVLSAIGALGEATGVVEGSVRLTVTRGRGPRGIAPPGVVVPTVLLTMAVAAGPLPPARVGVASQVREASVLTRIKSLNALPYVLARIEARRMGWDDALLVNSAGRVVESTAAAVVAVLGGEVLTPRVEDGALPGMGGGVLIEAGLCREGVLTVADLQGAEGMFLVNALSVRAVCEVAGVGVSVDLGWGEKVHEMLKYRKCFVRKGFSSV